MGQAGSVEQKNAIRDIVSIKVGQGKYEKELVLQALQTFCEMFPAEQAMVADDGAGFDVKDRKLFDVVHALLREQTVRTEKNSNEDLVRLRYYWWRCHLLSFANVAQSMTLLVYVIRAD